MSFLLIGVSRSQRIDLVVPAALVLPALLVIGLKFGQLTSVLRLSGGCLVMVDITKPVVPFSMRINATGAGQLTLGVPSNPGLIGSTVMAQALVGMTSGTLGADLTAGLEMTVGR